MRLFNRVLIAADAFIKGLNKKNKYTGENKNVLIVFQQIFGDSVVIQNSLEAYTRLFPAEKGYHIKFLARPSVLSFMYETMELPETIEFEALDFKRFLEDYRYYKSVVNTYKNYADLLIVPGTSLSAEIFSTANHASRKVGLVKSIDVEKPLVMSIFNKIAYTERVRPEMEDMMLERHRKLIHYLGLKEYKAKLPKLLFKEKVVDEERYCVMCPGASKTEKCWPTEHFVEIADYIIEKYDMNVHLCGGVDEVKYEEHILNNSKCSERIISHIGKTSFSEWSSIVQHSVLVVGNDSATMHLAVASRRKAVCIAGVYDKFMFFPYKVDELDDRDVLPVTLIKDMSCEWCRTIGYDAGYGNTECRNRIKNGLCACCIDAITVEEMKKKIDLLICR